MPDDPNLNTVSAEGASRSTAKGDVPEALRRRYYLDERGGAGLGFYVDARIQTAVFRDHGRQLVARRSDPNVIRDMAAVAQHRGWTAIAVRGATEFRREAWLTATALGLEVRGYNPTDRDRQDLERRRAALARNDARKPDQRAEPEGRGDRGGAAAARANMRVVEAVVRARVVDRPTQDRILSAARERVVRWLEQGARLQPLQVSPAQAQQESQRARERQRSR